MPKFTKSPKRPFFTDATLVPRIQTYLNEKIEEGRNPTFILKDIPGIVEYLTKTYSRSYSRLSRVAFTSSVTKAVQVITTNQSFAETNEAESRKEQDDKLREELNERMMFGDDDEDGDDMDLTDASDISNANNVSTSGTNTPAATVSGTSTPLNPNMLNAALVNRYTKLSDQNKENGTKEKEPKNKRKSGDVKNRKRRKVDHDRTDTTLSEFSATIPTAKFSQLGGIDHLLQDVRELIEYPLTHPEIFVHLGIEPARGILLHGPPGCGKTVLANAIAGELGVPLIKISAPEIVSGMSGESEAKIRDLFEQAKLVAPCLIFMDEIDAITPKRENAKREMERRIVAQLLTSIDELSMANTDNKPVIVIGATNLPESLDPALRRAGRFDREIALGIPDKNGREKILRVKSEKLRISGDIDFSALAQKTPGFVGADLEALTKEAAVIAINRIFKNLQLLSSDSALTTKKEGEDTNKEETSHLEKAQALNILVNGSAEVDTSLEVITPLNDDDVNDERYRASSALRAHRTPLTEEQLSELFMSMDDFNLAVGKVQPSAKREGFATIPDVCWSDIGALKDIRDELTMTILEPIKCPEKFAAVGLGQPAGCLLYGPPGCGKTLLAKAIANESGASFISIKGPELLNKYVGESERSIRLVFERARTSSPCVMFFDELDALCPRRGSESAASVRVVNQLLTEMDGLESRKQVFVIGATNRPDMIDPAMLRPGRLDKLLFVDLPSAEGREDIMKTLSRKSPLDSNVDLHALAFDARMEGFSGADLDAFNREATVLALRESLEKKSESVIVCQSHYIQAFAKVQPSVSKKDQKIYQSIKGKLRKARSNLTEPEPVPPTNSTPINNDIEAPNDN